MCTIYKSAHTKKSGNLFNDPRIYMCLYICKRWEVREGEVERADCYFHIYIYIYIYIYMGWMCVSVCGYFKDRVS